MKLISITKGKGTLWDMELAKTIGKFHCIYNIICLTSIRTKQAKEKLMHNIRLVPFYPNQVSSHQMKCNLPHSLDTKYGLDLYLEK